MPGTLFSFAVDMALLPARTARRSAAALLAAPGEVQRLLQELRSINEEVSREMSALLSSVDHEMEQRASHLSPEQQQRAADMALDAAQQHLDMAARDLLRALWLHVHAARRLPRESSGNVIEQQS
jgi:exonuclease VII large subunit